MPARGKTNFAETYENYQELVSPAGIEAVEQMMRATPDSTLAQEAGAFRQYLAHKYLAAQTARLSDSLAALASARLPGRIPCRSCGTAGGRTGSAWPGGAVAGRRAARPEVGGSV